MTLNLPSGYVVPTMTNLTVQGRPFLVTYDPGTPTWYATELNAEGRRIGDLIEQADRDMVLILIGQRVYG